MQLSPHLHVGVERLDLRRHVDVPVEQALHGRRAEQLRQVPAPSPSEGSAWHGMQAELVQLTSTASITWRGQITTSLQQTRACRMAAVSKAGQACTQSCLHILRTLTDQEANWEAQKARCRAQSTATSTQQPAASQTATCRRRNSLSRVRPPGRPAATPACPQVPAVTAPQCRSHRAASRRRRRRPRRQRRRSSCSAGCARAWPSPPRCRGRLPRLALPPGRAALYAAPTLVGAHSSYGGPEAAGGAQLRVDSSLTLVGSLSGSERLL